MALTDRVVIVGAGMAGLVAALLLASRGVQVIVAERASGPGGKLREVAVAGRPIDAGPTVFTLRTVFEEIFASAGASLGDHLALRPAEVLARHAWSADERLDLFADRQRSAAAIGELAGPEDARGYLRFCEDARRIYATLEHSFIQTARPSLPGLVGSASLRDLWQIKPFTTLWGALGSYFRDPRLRQLFGRYATYCGSSPFLAPATLMLVAHVEQEGVWLVEGGMHRLATVLATLARERGAAFRYGGDVREVLVEGGRAVGVRLANGETIPADAVLVNADVAALAMGRFGAMAARAVPPPRHARSLSAVTWALVARAEGFPLVRHNVFFSPDYAAEFEDIFDHARLPTAPTVYACAQDRDDAGTPPKGSERLLCLVNAPAAGDRQAFEPAEIEPCARRTFGFLERCGLKLRPEDMAVTTPATFERFYPATGGALYGQASHGWKASFDRPWARTKLPGLYLAGGSSHPGPGLPMAALSGKMASACILEDLASTSRWRRAATPGGTSTR